MMPTHLLDQEVKVLGNFGSEACIYKNLSVSLYFYDQAEAKDSSHAKKEDFLSLFRYTLLFWNIGAETEIRLSDGRKWTRVSHPAKTRSFTISSSPSQPHSLSLIGM
jgi:hypothetical protein